MEGFQVGKGVVIILHLRPETVKAYPRLKVLIEKGKLQPSGAERIDVEGRAIPLRWKQEPEGISFEVPLYDLQAFTVRHIEYEAKLAICCLVVHP